MDQDEDRRRYVESTRQQSSHQRQTIPDEISDTRVNFPMPPSAMISGRGTPSSGRQTPVGRQTATSGRNTPAEGRRIPVSGRQTPMNDRYAPTNRRGLISDDPVPSIPQSVYSQSTAPTTPQSFSHSLNTPEVQPLRPRSKGRTSTATPSYTNPPQLKSHLSAISQRTSLSHYTSDTESEFRIGRGIDDDKKDLSDDESRLPRRNSHIVTQASFGKKVKPVITTMGSVSRKPQPANSPPGSVLVNNNASIEELHAAIEQGLSISTSSRPGLSRADTNKSAFRMPFTSGPDSPSSIYSAATSRPHDSVPVSSYNHSVLPATIKEHEFSDDEDTQSRYQNTPLSERSTARLIGFGVESRCMSDKFPQSKRPPNLNIEAVREMEARGSTTSLADLIRRATKLASNLDRGKTASRHLDMFYGNESPNSRQKPRGSTYSDMLASFPPPALGTPTTFRSGDRPQTLWPAGEKDAMNSKSRLSHVENQKPVQRTCFGLRPSLFVLVVLFILVVVAAAVVVPIFLIVIPKQKAAASAHCAGVQCYNGGTIVRLETDCACICAGGFTSSNCAVGGDPDCTTSTFDDGPNVWKDATIGGDVMPVLSATSNVPLNSTTLLSTFSANNLSCASENSLVMFSSVNRRRSIREKRLFILDDLAVEPIHVPSKPVVSASPHLAEKRQDSQTENGIVYATASSSVAQTSQPTTSPATSSHSYATRTNSNNAQPTNGVNATQAQTSFAGAVVLYVLEVTNSISTAVEANQLLSQYFMSGGNSTNVVVVTGGNGNPEIVADMKDFWVTSNGQRVSSNSS